MQIQEIVTMIDDEKLKTLGELHKIDKINTKITGAFILKAFVKSALTGIPISLRSIETLANKDKTLASYLKTPDPSKKRLDHSSLGKRLKTINADFFKEIYEDMVMKFQNTFSSQKSFHVFDSTIISISGKLMKSGLKIGGAKDNRHIKMSVSLKNSIPSSIRFCSKQSEGSEDIALARAINEARVEKEDIILFDRGIAKAETFDQFTKEEKFFVTRVNPGRKYRLLSSNKIEKSEDSNLIITSDVVVYLYNRKSKEIKCKLRLIKAMKTDGSELWFLSNLLDLSAYEITLSYKFRWQIEVLFKFLKQHLQFKEFISYDQNGMKVYLYSLLIAAILFTVYKINNKLKGYKLAMLGFMLDLNKAIIKDIVLFCGGDPALVDQKL